MARAEQDVLNALSPNTIYTIGHSNHPLQTFLELLRRHEIEVLIDTRSSPFSRYAPHFNRDALKAAVQDAGMKYGFYGRELGGRPENQAFYDAQGRADYAQIAASERFQSGLARLVAGAARCRTALLCSEENPSVCHRRLLIARTLFDQEVSVCHIRGDGCLETESELREAEAAFAREQEARREEERVAAELKAHAVELRRAARRVLSEAAACQKLQHRQAAEAARVEKQQKRREAAEQQSSERKRQAAERKRLRLEASQIEASQKPRLVKPTAPKKETAPRLFDMEEP